MKKPLVALVGRPNVGKSTLFNRLAGKRLAVVDDLPGTTRDRLLAETEWTGRVFDIMDPAASTPPTQQPTPGSSRFRLVLRHLWSRSAPRRRWPCSRPRRYSSWWMHRAV